MGKGNNAPAKAGATSEEVKEKEVVAEVVETATEETATETAEVVETAKEEPAPVNGEFEVKGKKYKLSDRCPGKVQFDGTVYTRKELLTNEEVLQSLVIGESPFVKKV
jgi:hypothetical protein